MFIDIWNKVVSPKKVFSIENDCFSDGQIRSKLWLCESLESVVASNDEMFEMLPFRISILAGWNGTLPFLLRSRGNVNISKIDLFDQDAKSIARSYLLNDVWRFEESFAAHKIDINKQNFQFVNSNLWINTSCEHFDNFNWWNQIQSGSLVVLQGNNMPHAEHVHLWSNLKEFVESWGQWQKVFYSGQLDFNYETFKFSRFMVIGIKGDSSRGNK